MATAREESGAGSVFGHKVSAYLMARLGSRQSYAPFSNSPIVELTLQCSHLGVPFDDQVVTVIDGLKRRRHLLQCKIQLTVQPSNKTFQDVLSRVYVALVSNKGLNDDDLFVIVCQECGKASELENLFRFASGSQSLQELKEKLAPENSKLLTLLQVVIDALMNSLGTERMAEIAHLDDAVVHALVRRMRIWQCDLNNAGSNDRRHAEHTLMVYCNSSVETARRLYEIYVSEAAGSEARRETFTWDSLRSKFGGLNEPSLLTDFERELSAEAVLRFNGEVDSAIQDLSTRTFESYMVLRGLLESNEASLAEAMSSPGIEAAAFVDSAAKAIRAVAMSLLKMNGSKAVLREWLEQCQRLAPRYGPLWFPIAKIALELEDEMLFREVSERVADDGERFLANGLALFNRGELDQSKAVFERVQGNARPDALLTLGLVVAKLDPAESGHRRAIAYLDEAINLKPESVILRLTRANHLYAQYLPIVSTAYLPGFDNGQDIANDLSESIAVLDEATYNSSLGCFERLVVARIRYQLFTLLPTLTALLPVSKDEILAIVSLQGPGDRRRAAELVANCGDRETADQILESIGSDGDSDNDPDETARLLASVGGDVSLEVAVPRMDNQTITGMSLLRQGFFGSIDIEPSLASQFLSAATTSPIECSFIPEMKFASYLIVEDIEQASSTLDELMQRFPSAVGTWGLMLHWLSHRADRFRMEQGSADIPKGSITLSLRVSRHLCTLLPFNEHYATWIQLAACDKISKTNDLDEIGIHAASKGNKWAEALARALAYEDSKDYVNAATYFDAAMDEGDLSRDLRVLRDQCKWFARRFDDLAAGKDVLLADKRRHPGQVQATISALRELDRGAIAWQVAQANQEDFPDDEIAHWIAFHTAKGLGLEKEWSELLESYTHKFPQSERVWRIEVGESSEGVLSIMDQQREGFELWQQHYARCDMPLKLLPGKLSFSYHVQSGLLTGLQTTRAGFGLRVASAEELSNEIILDETAILTLSKFGLWEQLISCGMKLVIPDFVENDLRAEARVLEIERDSQIESRLDRINTFLRHPVVRVCHQVTDEQELPIVGLTYAEADRTLAKKHGLIEVGDRAEDGSSLQDVLHLAQRTGRLSSAHYFELSDELRETTDQGITEFPTKILLDNHAVETMAQLPNVDVILALFDEVWVSPSAMHGLSLQLGRVEPDRASRVLMQRIVLDLDKHLNTGAVLTKSTTTGKLEEVDYFKAICSLAAESGLAVWADDMATRRLLTGHDPVCASVSTLELLVHLCHAGLMEKDEAELHVLELVENGHRDPFWPDLLRWRRDLPVSEKYRRTYVSRLAWQVRKSHLNMEEKRLYLGCLAQNLCSSIYDSEVDFFGFFDIALQALDEDVSELMSTMIDILQLIDRPDINSIVVRLAETAQESGKFSLDEWCRTKLTELEIATSDFSEISDYTESAKFELLFATFARSRKAALKHLERFENPTQ